MRISCCSSLPNYCPFSIGFKNQFVQDFLQAEVGICVSCCTICYQFCQSGCTAHNILGMSSKFQSPTQVGISFSNMIFSIPSPLQVYWMHGQEVRSLRKGHWGPSKSMRGERFLKGDGRDCRNEERHRQVPCLSIDFLMFFHESRWSTTLDISNLLVKRPHQSSKQYSILWWNASQS